MNTLSLLGGHIIGTDGTAPIGPDCDGTLLNTAVKTGAVFIAAKGVKPIGPDCEPCSCGPSCDSGTVVFDQMISGPFAVASDGIGSPTFGVGTIVLPDLTCDNYVMTIEADCQWTGTVPTPPSGGAAIHAYVADSSSDLATRAFVSGNHASGQLANVSLLTLDGAYHHYTFFLYPGGVNPQVSIAGPQTGQTLFLWPPVLPPDFVTGFWNIKNIHVVITVQ